MAPSVSTFPRLREAYKAWVKTEPRKKSTYLEFARGIDRFIELHGDLDVV